MPYDFSLSEQQELFQQEAARVAGELLTYDLARQALDQDLRPAMDAWRSLAGLGYAGVCAPEAQGGSGLGILELVLLGEQLGAKAARLPLVWHNAALHTIGRAAPSALRSGLLEGLAGGKQVVTVAHSEAGDRQEATAIDATLSDGGALRLQAKKLFVPFATVADYFLVSARTGDGYALVLVPAGDAQLRPYNSTAGDARANLEIDAAVPADLVVYRGGPEPVEGMLDAVRTALCGFLTGVCQAAMDLAVSYAKDRVIFGRVLGSFQALQHRAADMLCDVEAGRFLTYEAAWRLDAGLPAGDAVGAACAYVAAGSHRVLRHSHQMHGAIGYTWEHNLPMLTTLIQGLAADLGREDVNRERVAVSMGI